MKKLSLKCLLFISNKIKPYKIHCIFFIFYFVLVFVLKEVLKNSNIVFCHVLMNQNSFVVVNYQIADLQVT